MTIEWNEKKAELLQLERGLSLSFLAEEIKRGNYDIVHIT